MASLSVSFKPALLVKLDEVSSSLGVSKSKIAESALVRYFDELEEELDDLAMAEAISKEISEGRMKTYTLAEIEKELGL